MPEILPKARASHDHRILGIDFGTKRIGLALSEPSQKIAFEYQTWAAADFFKKIAGLVSEKKIERMVLGYPLNLKGGHSRKTNEAITFKNKLARMFPDMAIDLLDERFSTRLARGLSGQSLLARGLRQPGGIGKSRPSRPIDSLAAQTILQNYLDKRNSNVQNKKTFDQAAAS